MYTHIELFYELFTKRREHGANAKGTLSLADERAQLNDKRCSNDRGFNYTLKLQSQSVYRFLAPNVIPKRVNLLNQLVQS